MDLLTGALLVAVWAFITMIDAQSLLFSIMVSAGSVKYF